MKKLLFVLLWTLPSMASAQQEVSPDSISNNLDEVVVTADAQIEAAKKLYSGLQSWRRNTAPTATPCWKT